MTSYPLPPGLPTIHPLALVSEALFPHSWLRVEHVLRCRKPVVGGEEDGGAQARAGQVVKLGPGGCGHGVLDERSVSHGVIDVATIAVVLIMRIILMILLSLYGDAFNLRAKYSSFSGN